MISEIKEMNYGGLEDYPKFSYHPVLRGQAIYILKRCKEKNLKADYFFEDIQIYSKTKLPEFEVIIKESLQYHSTIKLEKESQAYHVDRHFLGIAIKKEDIILATEESFPEIVYYQFQNKIPVTQHYKIFSTQHDLKQEAESRYNVLI